MVQFEDDATYAGETPRWPRGPADAAAAGSVSLRLTVQAAERRRPTVLVDPAVGWADPAAPVSYDALEVSGIALGGEGWSGLEVPPTRTVRLSLLTLLHAENTVTFQTADEAAAVTVRLCQTAGLRVAGPGVLVVQDSVVDAGAGTAVDVPSGRAELTGCRWEAAWPPTSWRRTRPSSTVW